MTSTTCQQANSQRTAGPRLRCFLGTALIALSALLMQPAALQAQPAHEGDETVHIGHVQGIVVNGRGKVVAGAEIEFRRGDEVIFATKTDNDGIFEFEGAHGPYTMRVKPGAYSAATREIVVGELAMMVTLKNTLYVILGPAACTDECSSVFTSKRKFDQAIRRKSGQNN